MPDYKPAWQRISDARMAHKAGAPLRPNRDPLLQQKLDDIFAAGHRAQGHGGRGASHGGCTCGGGKSGNPCHNSGTGKFCSGGGSLGGVTERRHTDLLKKFGGGGR